MIYPDTYNADDDLDTAHNLRVIAREVRKHGCKARVVARAHVLAMSPDGSIVALRTRSAALAWLGY